MKLLGIETSCDETSAAIVGDDARILSNVVRSQVELHRPYGGVVPELASRDHLGSIEAVVSQSLHRAGCRYADLDAIAATYGPGLASSLLIGLNAGKGIAAALGKPFLAINHVEAHLYSPLLAVASESDRQASLPTVALIVSGGHTILAKAHGIGQHEILGHTVDDAAGEAFDKVAKLLRLPYPGGPEVEKLARQGNARAVEFPRGMMDDPNFHFSFSGLKTAVLYYLQKHPGARVPDVCASFQEAVVEVLTAKTIRAAEHTGARTVSLAGGVAANRCLRERLQVECDRRGLRLLLAPPSLCTDNAGMIAALACFKLRDAAHVGHDWSVDVAPSIGLGQGRN